MCRSCGGAPEHETTAKPFESVWDKISSIQIQAALDGEPLSQFDDSEPETSAKPTRYNQGELEYWDAVEKLGWSYRQGTAGKYIHRYKDKNGPEDLCKAINYIIKMLSQETGIDYYELHKLTPEELAKRVKK
jgi:hypothetical protein